MSAFSRGSVPHVRHAAMAVMRPPPIRRPSVSGALRIGGQTLHEGPSAYVVIPAQSFEFRGPFGTPAHAGKSGAVARRGRWFLAQ